MGNVAGVFEAIARPCPQQAGSTLWPDDVHAQQLVSCRPAEFWGSIGGAPTTAPSVTTARVGSPRINPPGYRHATVITIPNRASTTFQDNIFDFFRSSVATDLAIPGQSLCPYCADSVHENRCGWTLLPWTPDNARDRIFFGSSCVFRGVHGHPMATSTTFTMGATYSLVWVSYFVALGGGSRMNHFVCQVRIRGRWHKYD